MKQNYHDQIKLINSAISRTSGLYEEWAKKHDINYYALLILYKLNENVDVTQKQICEEYRIPKQTINNVITDLKNKGYISVETNQKNKKEKTVKLTDKGIAYSKEKIIPLLEIEENVIKGMGSEYTSQLIEAANKYGDFFEEEMLKEAKNKDT